MKDPFQDEEKHFNNIEEYQNKYNGKIELVYPEYRYVYNNSPYTVYIPTAKELLKLMRACIGVTKPEDLIFFDGVSRSSMEAPDGK